MEVLLETPIIKTSESGKIERFYITRYPRFQPGGFDCIAWEIWIKTSTCPFSGIIYETMKPNDEFNQIYKKT